MMLEVAMGVMDMEDDKVADMAMKIPNEDFTDETLAIDDTQGGGDWGVGHGGWQGGQWGDQHDGKDVPNEDFSDIKWFLCWWC